MLLRCPNLRCLVKSLAFKGIELMPSYARCHIYENHFDGEKLLVVLFNVRPLSIMWSMEVNHELLFSLLSLGLKK